MSFNSAALESAFHLKNIDNKTKTVGAFSYFSGTNGSVNIPAGSYVTEISAYNDTAVVLGAASFTIDGGSAITVPENDGIDLSFKGDSLLGPVTITFTATSSYYIGVVSAT
jgi:hypothetical protein